MPPLKLTDATHAAVVRALGTGATLDEAADRIGVHRSTLHRWLQIGRRCSVDSMARELSGRESRCVALFDASASARAQMRVDLLAAIQRRALSGDCAAAQLLLGILFPDEFAA
jgi:transposase-like protein